MVEVHLYRVDDGLNIITLSQGNFEKKRTITKTIFVIISFISLSSEISG